MNKAKYTNPMNFGREDDNKFGLNLGDIVHIAGSYSTANGYNYCGYEPFDIPAGSRARIIGINQTGLNASYQKDGRGDVYVDYELVDHTNPDGTQITCGNRHAGCFAETSPNFAPCPDGSGDLGYLWPKNNSGYRWSGMWTSMMGTSSEDGTYTFTPHKMLDPSQYV